MLSSNMYKNFVKYVQFKVKYLKNLYITKKDQSENRVKDNEYEISIQFSNGKSIITADRLKPEAQRTIL